MDSVFPAVFETLFDGRAIERTLALFAPVHTASRPVRLRNEVQRGAADDILAAADRTDLENRLDAWCADDALWASTTSAAAQTTQPVDFDAAKLDMTSLSRVLGAAAAQRCAQGHSALLLLARFILSAKDGIAAAFEKAGVRTPQPSPSPRRRDVKLSDVFYEPAIPLVARQAIAKFCRSMLAAMAIGRAEERGDKLDPWLALALGDAFAGTFEEWLALVRSGELPALFVSFVQGLGSSASEGNRLREALERWRSEAVAKGESVYFPLSADAFPAR
jgi:hypothetical protein